METEIMKWRIHTTEFFNRIQEISSSLKETEAIIDPLIIFRDLLVQVGKRASKLDDPIMNALMCRLTIYGIADPQDKENYNPKLVKKVLEHLWRF